MGATVEVNDGDRPEWPVYLDGRPAVVDSSTIEPGGDLGRVEADQPPNLQVWHPSLGDEPADVADAHPEPLGELVDGEELGQGVGIGHRSP